MLLPIMLSVAYLLIHAQPLCTAFKRCDPEVMTQAAFAVMMVVLKIFVRSLNNLAKDCDVCVSLAARSLVNCLEETLEFSLPLLALLSLGQNYVLRCES